MSEKSLSSVFFHFSPLAVGMGLLSFIVSLLIFSSLSLLLNLPITPFLFWLSLATGIATTWFTHDRKYVNSIGLISLIALSLLSMAFVPDFSYDGVLYHQQTVVLLQQGWNPWYDAPTDILWINHYAKGMEIMEAAIYSATHCLESSKGVNLILIICSSLLFTAALRRFLPDLKRSYLVSLLLIAALNPVGIAQLATFYIDFAKYYIWIITFVLCVFLYNSTDRRSCNLYLCALIGVSVLAISVKFNIAFEQGLIWLGLLIFGAFKRKEKPDFILTILEAGIGTALISLLIFSHPYITNFIDFGNPVYPLMGDSSVDIMTPNLLPEVAGKDRFTAFIYCLNRYVPPIYDTRLGGFGPFMPFILVLSLCVWIIYFRAIPAWMNALAIFSIATCFIFPQTWWPRYICQLWLFPLVVFTGCALRGKSGRISMLVCIAAILTSGLIIARTGYRDWQGARWQAAIIKACGKTTITTNSNRPQLKAILQESGVENIIVQDDLPADSDYVAVPWNPFVENGIMIILNETQLETFNAIKPKFKGHL